MDKYGIQSNGASSQLSDDHNIGQLLADFLNEKRQSAIKLLKINGVNVNTLSSDTSIRVAFLKAIKDSDVFRNQASEALTGYVSGRQNNFVNNNQYLNAVTDLAPTTIDPNYGKAVTPTTTTTSTKSGFWSSLGNIFTPDVIQAGVKTGLTALSSKLQANANSSSEANALALEQLRLQQMQAQAEINKTAPKKGLSTGGWIAVTVGGAGLIGLIVWLAVRKKK